MNIIIFLLLIALVPILLFLGFTAGQQIGEQVFKNNKNGNK